MISYAVLIGLVSWWFCWQLWQYRRRGCWHFSLVVLAWSGRMLSICCCVYCTGDIRSLHIFT